MKAAWYERNGAARDVLTVGEMDTPVPGPGEVRVKIATSGVNPSDVKSRQGRPRNFPRIIPHSDGAGVIDAVGNQARPRPRSANGCGCGTPSGSVRSAPRRSIACWPDEQAVKLPDRVDFAAGACLGIPALTALQAVRLHGPIAGKTLLVTGAGSAVGYYVTQIAKARGARVIGTASEAKAEHARSAGADFVIDYKHKDVAKVTKELTRGDGVHGIVDMDLSKTAALIADGVVRPHGMIVCYGSNVAGDVADLVSRDAVEQLRAQGVRRLRAEAGRSPRRDPGAHDTPQGRCAQAQRRRTLPLARHRRRA